MSIVDSIVDTIQEQLGSWEPEHATEISEVLQNLGQIPGALRDALMTQADRLESESDVKPVVSDALREAASAFDGTVDGLDEAYSTLRDAHEEQYERLDTRPVGGEKWDISQNPN